MRWIFDLLLARIGITTGLKQLKTGFWACLYVILLFQRILWEDMPTKSFFDLLRETDKDFVARTGWEYRHDAPLYVPNPLVQVQDPVQRQGVPFKRVDPISADPDLIFIQSFQFF